MGAAPPAPTVSVVVATRDRARLLRRLLAALAESDPPAPSLQAARFEVVVADDGSNDSTAETVEALAADVPYTLRLVRSELPSGPAGARNRGWRAARGTKILFTDDDCVPVPAWVREMAAALETADVAVGATRPPPDQLSRVGPFSSYLDMDHNGRFSTCNVGYRRGLLEALDGFDEVSFRYANGEDTDLGLRARRSGCRETFVEAAVVRHDVQPSDFKAYMRRVSRLDGIVALVARHPESRELLDAGCFLRSADKAALLSWATVALWALGPRRRIVSLALPLAGAVYVRQFKKSYYPPRSFREWLTSVPLAFVADSWTLVVMARSSLRHRTLLL